MSINLQKRQKINLLKTLKKVGIGLGWDVNPTVSGSEFDLDLSVFMLGSNKKIPREEYFVFYNNKNSIDGAVVYDKDNRDGQGEGDDETLEVDLTKVDSSIQELVFIATIYQCQERKQNFGLVKNCFIRIYDWFTKQEIAKYELDEDYGRYTAFEFAKLYRENGNWLFQAIGDASPSDLQAFVDKYYNS